MARQPNEVVWMVDAPYLSYCSFDASLCTQLLTAMKRHYHVLWSRKRTMEFSVFIFRLDYLFMTLT